MKYSLLLALSITIVLASETKFALSFCRDYLRGNSPVTMYFCEATKKNWNPERDCTAPLNGGYTNLTDAITRNGDIKLTNVETGETKICRKNPNTSDSNKCQNPFSSTPTKVTIYPVEKDNKGFSSRYIIICDGNCEVRLAEEICW